MQPTCLQAKKKEKGKIVEETRAKANANAIAITVTLTKGNLYLICM